MSNKRLIFLGYRNTGLISEYPILAMQRAAAAQGVKVIGNAASRPVRFVARALARAHMMRRVATVSANAYLTPIMLLSEWKLLPYCYYAETIVYIFDCWPALYPRWEKFFRRQRMRVTFFSARQSAEYFAERIPEMESIWLPEAVDPDEYRGDKPLEQRSIDVLELGRRSAPYHDKITGPLAQAGRVHKYEPKPGTVIFPTREALIDGFADAKVSVCFPSSLTHPARSAHVETVTLRYFESMAAGCILVGRCPAELKDLFGYNPVIEADIEGDAAGQIESIVRDVTAHAPLVARNRARLMEVGTWHARVATMLSLLQARGYRLGDNG